MLSMKVLLISIGAVSSAMLVKSSVPLVLYEFPTIWSSFISSWLKPPYLYVLLNCIIIIIAATSRSHRREHSSGESQPLISARSTPLSDLIVISQPNVNMSEPEMSELSPEPVDESEVFEVKAEPVNIEPQQVVEVENDDQVVISNSVVTSLPEVETELLQQLATEKPLVSSRFGHRKPLTRMNPEGNKYYTFLIKYVYYIIPKIYILLLLFLKRLQIYSSKKFILLFITLLYSSSLCYIIFSSVQMNHIYFYI